MTYRRKSKKRQVKISESRKFLSLLLKEIDFNFDGRTMIRADEASLVNQKLLSKCYYLHPMFPLIQEQLRIIGRHPKDKPIPPPDYSEYKKRKAAKKSKSTKKGNGKILGVVSLQEIFKLVGPVDGRYTDKKKRRTHVEVLGLKIALKQKKLKLFKSNPRCACCDTKAEYFQVCRTNTSKKGEGFLRLISENGIPFTVDHIVPKARGGDKTALHNLQSMCEVCNNIKGDMSLSLYEKQKELIAKREKVVRR